MRIEANEMLKNLTSITATKRVALLFCVLVLMTAGVATCQQGSGSGSGSGSGRGFGSGSGAGSGSSQQSTNEATTIFRSARDLITDGNWARAQEKFNEYVTSFPNEKNMEAALYWLAYAQYKLAKYDQLRSTVDRLLQKYPETTWREDARMLLAQTPGVYAIAAEDIADTLRAAAPLPPLEAPVIYTPGAPIATVGVTPMPGQAIEVPSAWMISGASNLANDDDPCEFKIVV